MTDQIVPSETTSAPYYDDFDETKEFYRILFRPGYAVQARELTQLQTILQKQVQRFGDHIFKNGSMVLGGQVTYQGYPEKIRYINLQSTYAGTTVTANSFVGKVIEVANTVVGNARAYVIAAAELTSTQPPTLVVKFLNDKAVSSNDRIQTIEATPVYANIAVSAVSGNSSVVSIDSGVYFYNGYFAKVLPQTIILDQYGDAPSYRVGLEFDDSIVTSDDDTSLLDPAQEASNYQAPGATRYKIDLVLAKRTQVSTDDTKFINLLTLEEGAITQKVEYSVYSELEKTLARRTFDESGHYTVKPFIGSLHNHAPEQLMGNVSGTAGTTTITGVGTRFLDQVSANSIISVNSQFVYVASVGSNTTLTTANTLTYNTPLGFLARVANPEKFSFTLAQGKAYVRGFEFETISPFNMNSKRSRTFANVGNYDLYSPLGNYLFVTRAIGIPNISTNESYDIHVANSASVNITDSANYANTKIGTLRLRALEYSSAGATGNARSYIYKAYVSNVTVANSTHSLADAKSLVVLNSATAGQYNQLLEIDASSKANGVLAGNTTIQESNFNTLIYRYPQQYIVPGSISDVDYRYRKFNGTVDFTSGTATMTLSAPEVFPGSGALADADALTNFIVTVTDKKSTAYANGEVLPMISSNTRTVTISGAGATATLTDGANTFTAEVIHSVDLTGTAPGPRAKTRVNANTSVVPTVSNSYIATTTSSVFTANGVILVNDANNVVKTIGTDQNLYLSDVIRISKVFDFGANAFTTANLTATSTSDITANYQLDNGQRDSLYDHAAIRLRPGKAAPLGRIAVFVDYYTHAGTSGYLTVDSYPDVTSTQGYANVAAYGSPTTGELYFLRDCVDWRPKRLNGTETYTLVDSDAGTTSYILQPGQSFDSDFSYYLSRIDKIVLTKDRQFRVMEGVPDLYPSTPAHDQEDMLLYTLKIPAYTASAADVDVRYNENKRYTMRDIGRIEKRVENLEYYASLNLLEKNAESLTILDGAGLTRFKNGILVDSFNGHKVGDVQSTDYKCSMDFEKGELWPPFSANNSQFVFNSGASTGVRNHAGIITLDYTTETYISQNVSTGPIAVNDFGYATFVSKLSLFPDNDTWYDRNARPLVLVNVEGENDAYESSAINGFGTRYNEWSSAWAGLPVQSVQNSEKQFYPGFELIDQGVSRSTNSTTNKQARSLVAPSNTPESIKTFLGDAKVDVSVVPYIREQDVIVRAVGVMPSTVYYPYFDNISVQSLWINPTLIVVSSPSGSFFSNTFERLTATSGGAARVVMIPATSSVLNNVVSNVVSVVMATGYINVGDTLTGAESGATAVVVSIKKYSDNVSGVNANTSKINLASSFTASNTSIVNSVIVVAKGFGYGQARSVVSYDNVTNVITVDKAWTTVPQANSIYTIGAAMGSKFGSVAGVLAIPSSRFVTGDKSIRLTTSPSNSLLGAASYADGIYYAKGFVFSPTAPTMVQQPIVIPDNPGTGIIITTPDTVVIPLVNQSIVIPEMTPSLPSSFEASAKHNPDYGITFGNYSSPTFNDPGVTGEAVWGGGSSSPPSSGYGAEEVQSFPLPDYQDLNNMALANIQAAEYDAAQDAAGTIPGKIICTAMNEAYGFGSFRQKIWLQQSASLSKAHEVGYHAMCRPLVKYIYRSGSTNWLKDVLRAVMEHIVKHRTADIWKQKKGKRDTLGMIYRNIFEPLVYAIGRLKGKK